MNLKDYIISSYADNVKNLPDYPGDSGYNTAQLKAAFDGRTDKEIKAAINAILSILTSDASLNTGVGLGAFNEDATGTGNTAAGYVALGVNTSGSNNTGIGDGALAQNTTGNQNTATGCLTVENNTTGSFNTGVGFRALRNNTTKSNNVGIGAYAGENSNEDNKFFLSNKQQSDNASEKANSLMYGEFAPSANSTTNQKLFVNADITVPTGKTIKIGNNAVALLSQLAVTTDGASGADLIGVPPIEELVYGGVPANTVYEVFKALKDYADKKSSILGLASTTDGDSGADNIGVTPIEELVEGGTPANTVQRILEALKAYADKKVNILDIVDALNSTHTDKPLSAKQGKVLNDGKADKSTTYTKTEADALLGAKANQSTTYNKGEVDNYISSLNSSKANKSETYTKGEVDELTTHTGDVTGAKALTIANNAVTEAKIVNNAITTNKLADLAVTPNKIATNAVTTAKIYNQAVTVGKLANMNDKILLGTNTDVGEGQNTVKQLTVSEVITMLGLSNIATSGSYADLTGKPTLGTASVHNTDYFIPAPITVTDLSSTTKTVTTLAENTDYQFGSLTSLTISAVATGYKSGSLAYTASGTATFSAPSSIKWIGADLNASGVFVPVSGKRYNIVFEHDGLNVVGKVGRYA